MVFAVRVTEGVKGPEDCPPLADREEDRLQDYLSQFRLDF